MLRWFTGTLVLFLSISVFMIAHAQLSGTDPLTISINPDYPHPYQIVTVVPASTVIDLNASTLTYSVNGKVVQTSSGAEPANVAVGGPGSATTISVTAVNNGQKYTQKITIRPSDVALILEPITTSHPFYEGASLIGSEGRLRLVAIPDLRNAKGVQIPSSSLVYTWKNGDQVLESASGIGKSVLTATAPVRYRDTVITVTVSSQDASVVGQASVLVSPGEPLIRIYENDPLLGPRYETSLPDSISLSGSEYTYRAVPYFFTTVPNLTWNVNGTPSQSGQDITVRATGNGKGTAVLQVSGSSGSLGQTANTGVSITFGSRSSGLFGL